MTYQTKLPAPKGILEGRETINESSKAHSVLGGDTCYRKNTWLMWPRRAVWLKQSEWGAIGDEGGEVKGEVWGDRRSMLRPMAFLSMTWKHNFEQWDDEI